MDLSIQIKAPDFENLGLHLKRESNVLDTLECLFVGLILFIVKLQTWWANWVISQGYKFLEIWKNGVVKRAFVKSPCKYKGKTAL